MKQFYECEKLEVEDGDGPYFKLVIFTLDEDSATVLDITSHDTEQSADEWLAKEWKISCPPPIGTRYKFESEA